jgi:hypothetical protein
MAVPSTFSELNTTPASNSGLISDSTAVNQIDNHTQTIYALIASIYANSGNGWASPYLPAANPSYTGTLTGGTGVLNLGSGQLYKDESGNLGIGVGGNPFYQRVTVYIGGAVENYLQIANGSTGIGASNGLRIGIDAAGSAAIMAPSAFPLSLSTSGIVRSTIDGSGNVINSVPATPPTLTTARTAVFNLTSDTNLRVSVRGVDGVTRVANITLA